MSHLFHLGHACGRTVSTTLTICWISHPFGFRVEAIGVCCGSLVGGKSARHQLTFRCNAFHRHTRD